MSRSSRAVSSVIYCKSSYLEAFPFLLFRVILARPYVARIGISLEILYGRGVLLGVELYSNACFSTALRDQDLNLL